MESKPPLPELDAQTKVDRNPYDTDSWNVLVREKQTISITDARPFYESLVAQFPNAGRYWRSYVEHELRGKQFEKAEEYANGDKECSFLQLFKRSINQVLSIDLWKCYLQYVREAKGRSPTFREEMAKMYDYALDKIGMDVTAYNIYADYIAFLRQVPTNVQQELQKMAAIRKVFHRGICTPIANVEQLWADYCVFEKGLNSHLADKLITERTKDYQAAKRVAKQLDLQQKGLQRNLVSAPPKGTANELKQVELWKKYIMWEKDNPLATQNHALLARRVSYAYEQALLCLGLHPDVWYEAAAYLTEAAQQFADRGEKATSRLVADEVASLYERATKTMLPNEPLLCFAYADYEETRMDYKKCEQIYRQFIDQPTVDPTLAYIQYHKFARRTEGLSQARAVFKLARDDVRSTYHVYVAAAMTEYYCTKDSNVARRIFDLGFKKYGGETGFAEAYIEFVAGLNEDNGTRVLFERILGSDSLPADKALRIWDLFLAFETRVGDLASIAKVDRRRREAVAKEYGQMPTLLLIDRYKFGDLRPCNTEQLINLGYQARARTICRKPSALQSSAIIANSVSSTEAQFSALVTTALASPVPTSMPAASHSTSNGPTVHIATPDPAQMCPFKPKVLVFSECPLPLGTVPDSYAPLPGGVFQPPPTVAHLLQQLPPPHCFTGPHVIVDALIERLRQGSSSEHFVAVKLEDGARVQDIKRDMYKLLATVPDPQAVITQTRKRRLDDDDEDGGTHHSGNVVAPVVDVYRNRLHKRHGIR